MLLEVLVEFCVPLHRVIGICSDGASTMMGRFKGVCTRLASHIREIREEVIQDIVANTTDIRRAVASFHPKRGVYVIHCVCHRLALILSDAIKGTKAYDPVIPDAVINLLNWLYAYFAKSPKRKHALRMLIDAKNRALKEERARAEHEGRRFPLPLITIRNPDDELEEVLKVLEERHKLPRRVVLTRWLSSADAVRVVLTCRNTYTQFFSHETSDKAERILELLEDNSIIAWYPCLQDVLPVLTSLNVLFQTAQPLPHLLYRCIVAAKRTLIRMVGTRGEVREGLIPLDSVQHDTPFGAYANKFLSEHCGATGTPAYGTRLSQREVVLLKKQWHNFFSHCIVQIDERFPPESCEMFQLLQGMRTILIILFL